MSAVFFNSLNPIAKLEIPECDEIVGVSGVGSQVARLAKIDLKLGKLVFKIACHVLKGPRYDVIIDRDCFDSNILGYDWVNEILKSRQSSTLMTKEIEKVILNISKTTFTLSMIRKSSYSIYN